MSLSQRSHGGGTIAREHQKFAAALLFFENQRGAADAFCLEIDIYLNPVSNLMDGS